MIDKNHVMEQFSVFAKLSDEEATTYSGILDAAVRQVEASLRTDVDPTEHPSALEYLCAALGYHKYALLSEMGDESIRALDLSVSRKKGAVCQNAALIRDDALIAARNLLKDDRFYFGRTAG